MSMSIYRREVAEKTTNDEKFSFLVISKKGITVALFTFYLLLSGSFEIEK